MTADVLDLKTAVIDRRYNGRLVHRLLQGFESECSMKMPVVFVGHGSPMNAIETNRFTEALAGLAKSLPRPKAVCVVSAHWVTRRSRELAAPRSRTHHDFY